MDVAQLLEPVLTGGVKDAHFFNGRILTADDLRTMQAAARQHDAQIARAMGEGVAHGLEVTVGGGSSTTQAVLHVEHGLAINALGERAYLQSAVDVALVPSTDDGSTPDGVFTICQPPTSGEFTNLGLYLFTIAPASGLDGHAPMVEVSSESVGTKCGSRYEVEGVTFNAVPLTLPTNATPDRSEARTLLATVEQQLTSASGGVNPSLEKLRNLVAHLCFGDDVEIDYARDLLTSTASATIGGWLQELLAQRVLSSCEVPLALIYWSKFGIEFVDMWAVRRRLHARRKPSVTWERLLAPTAAAEARLEQFQAHVDELRQGVSDPSTVAAATYFRYLPSAGILPLAGGSQSGFDLLTFFGATKHRKPAVIEGARVEQLLRDSLLFPSIDVNSAEHVWLYLVKENKQPVDNSTSPVPPYYVLFARGDMPYRGNAHFDVAHWDYASYALG
ncbi:MAG TPA: hypothetical protein VFA27_12280 [Vicinamibacterales bacterium]|nr:hypothetical protein [Vicinamibacterales bacterium]